ncbi:MAG: type II toxin-antitoxin system HicB family antitoxin [Acidobacteria bacterium]|nr:type II toxin-antitoxin system HicB family antitoxin [Acidobacteriota bacterium]
MDFAYPARLEEEPDGRYSVTFPDLPDAITQGEDRSDAIEMAADCLAETIGARIAERADIPVPSPVKHGQVRVVVPAYVAVKAALYVAMKQEGVSLNEMARTLDGQPIQVRRLLDPGRASSIKRIDHALSAIGRRVCVSLET